MSRPGRFSTRTPRRLLSGVALGVVLGAALAGCAAESVRAPGAARSHEIDRGVRDLLDQIAVGLEQRGPEAWLEHFADVPEFCMASSGELVFADLDEAYAFLEGFDSSVSSMLLEWSNVRVDPLGDGVAWVGAEYDEVLVETSGVEQRFRGYFSGVAMQTGDGWALRTLHWSSPP